MTRLQFAKEILRQANDGLPDLGYKAGLYLYSPFKPVYAMKTYNRDVYGDAIDSLPDRGRGPTLIQESLRKLDSVLAGLSGRTAVFVFWSGIYADMPGQKKPAQLAKELVQKYDVFFYVIDVEEDARGNDELRKLAGTREWGRVVPIEEIIDKPAGSVGAVFVLTPTVIERTKIVTRIVDVKLDNVIFDYNQSAVRSKFHDEMNALAGVLEAKPKSYVILAGHTCNRGPGEYNLRLSRLRAESVENYLVQNLGVSRGRIITQWYGETAPVVSNATSEGRSLNRRVEAMILGLD